jgi:tripartite-type tricarboxylate transporter receptor subunit TctC
MKTIRVCGLWLALLAAVAAATVTTAMAQSAYPVKPVRLIVPYPPGGGNDTLARIFGQKLTETLGQQVVVENRPGAGTTIGTTFVARAAPDGYTLLLSSIATHAFSPHLYAKPGYDALRDFSPVTLLVIAPTLLVVNPALPAHSLKELIALAKRRPGQLEFASGGTGSSAHMLGETFKSLANIDIIQIPYKGGAPAIVGTISGEAQMMVDPAASILPHVKSSRLRPLAIARATRLSDLPQVPTFAEAGMPQYTASAWYSVHAPAKTPNDIVARLNRELVRIVNLPDIKDRLKDLGSDGVGNTQEEFGRFVADEHAKYGKLIKAMGVNPE